MCSDRPIPAFFPPQAHVKVSAPIGRGLAGERAGLSSIESIAPVTWLGSRLAQLSFAARATGLQGLRALRNLHRPAAACDRLQGDFAAWPQIAGESSTPLWTSAGGAEWQLTAGKIENLRIAARYLNG